MTLRQLSHLNIQLPLPKAPVPRKLLHAVGRDHHLRVRGGNPFPLSPYHNGSFSWTGSI
jgi:hypothetical protein